MKLKQAEEIQSLMNSLRAIKDGLEEFYKIKNDGYIGIEENDRHKIYFRQNSKYTGGLYNKMHKYIEIVLQEEIKEIEDKINNIK